ncbi:MULTISPECIES: MarR family winged helix-turn-helix transcriptional regulator [unclassified Marinobacterium]|uniref:MarR family winged helix-turn-helix transcriptional regulator n=1 Tax=unclassified Marinobacterium TaxID=2644139 RepID=UPI001A046696|nr:MULTISPECIES: MarR family transcriptional regulator [unclassified Marinobacterium]NRP27220.1 HTH-type transcriptional repressor NicR [Marinobacterium sp. xm-d-420]NRP38468.1 HTH-type transcriptional repressor NicR [Marinobacterium sp. xm-a-121]NRP46833.1 HTH-type transcriptional repressor NicR [Marinobacterium sp. xm-d-543]NRP52596.1 HTH-type transcriptional repressor NicR [Marinobacterium sp. xm-v-242]NRP57978.1 HTH-type transcriptional repressor NicR [Marinobacterium sp. xm-d-510]
MSYYEMPGHLIRRLSQQSNQVFQDEMKRIGADVTSVQFASMQAIELHGEMEQSQIAQSIHYDKATIGGVIDRLEKRGWVERKSNPKDRRAKLVTLTKEGRKALEEITPVVKALQDQVVANLSDDERELFIKLAQKVVS